MDISNEEGYSLSLQYYLFDGGLIGERYEDCPGYFSSDDY